MGGRTIFSGVTDRGFCEIYKISIWDPKMFGHGGMSLTAINDDESTFGYWSEDDYAENEYICGEAYERLVDKIKIGDESLDDAIDREFGCADGFTRFKTYKEKIEAMLKAEEKQN